MPPAKSAPYAGVDPVALNAVPGGCATPGVLAEGETVGDGEAVGDAVGVGDPVWVGVGPGTTVTTMDAVVNGAPKKSVPDPVSVTVPGVDQSAPAESQVTGTGTPDAGTPDSDA